MGENKNPRALTVLAHAYLRTGHARQASVYLEQADKERDFEAAYLSKYFCINPGGRGQVVPNFSNPTRSSIPRM